MILLTRLIVGPKQRLHKWASITKQTPAAKIGYIGQHLASLITGVPGTGSGARGDDLSDGSEVKSCNKIDQVDKCQDCQNRVMRFETICPYCGSINIDRKDDSKWLFSVRDEYELNQYLNLDRVVLILMDYPNFKNNDFKDMRISAYEIYPKEERMKVFGELISNHYYNIFLPKLNANAKTNPMNLHPMGFQFYKCNPMLTFSCVIKNVSTHPEIIIDYEHYIGPNVVRDCSLPSLLMPSSLLKSTTGEWDTLVEKADFNNEILPLLTKRLSKEQFQQLSKHDKQEVLPYLTENLRNYIPLREIVSTRQVAHYHRR